MNCERCRTGLEDFVDGELSEAQAAAIRTHLLDCAECRAARETLERENEIFAQYYEQTALEPGPEMWAAIRSRLADERPLAQTSQPARWLTWLNPGRLFAPAALRQAAFAALLVILSVAATTLYFTLNKERQPDDNRADVKTATPHPAPSTEGPKTNSSPTPAPQKTESDKSELANGSKPSGAKQLRAAQVKYTEKPRLQSPGAASEDDLIERQVARAVREYQNAVVLLERKIERRRDALNPTLVAQYEKSIELIDRSIADSRRVMQQRPNDPAAGQFLLAAYAKKVELMQEIALQ
jgi:hypothetical protein